MKRAFFSCVALAIGVVGVALQLATATASAGNSFALMPGGAVVTGTVSYHTSPHHWQNPLPGMAMLHVELLDASAQGLRAPTIGEDTVWIAGGKMPVSFRIEYDPSRVDPGHVYVIRARIMDGETVLFTSARPHYVLTKGAPSTVDVIVVPVGRP